MSRIYRVNYDVLFQPHSASFHDTLLDISTDASDPIVLRIHKILLTAEDDANEEDVDKWTFNLRHNNGATAGGGASVTIDTPVGSVAPTFIANGANNGVPAGTTQIVGHASFETPAGYEYSRNNSPPMDILPDIAPGDGFFIDYETHTAGQSGGAGNLRLHMIVEEIGG